jgi:hypothetical protein
MNKLSLFLLLIITNLSIAFSQTVVPYDTLCTPNPSKEAVALYRYLLDMKGKKILSGQQDSPWGIDEFAYLQTNTGKQPAIKGMDFITKNDNAGEVQKAINWWKAGGIPTIMWHWGAPTKGDGYEQSKMEIDVSRCFVAGTAEYTAFWAELRMKADLLQKLKDANVPVLWRPYHELNGNWFWWGKKGSANFKKLWTTMFDYFVKERGLNNLIWVLCYTGSPDAAWYPGDQYVDIAGADTYGSGDGPQMNMYNAVKSITKDKFPIAYHECGIPPNPDQCISQGGMWSWWMEWHTDYLVGVDKTYLKYVYDHHLVITLDKVPNIMAVYGWTSSTCKPSIINPQIKVDAGQWQQTNKMNVGTGTSVIFSPQVTDVGTWSWSGYGTSGTVAEQTVNVNGGGTATAIFTNTCGAVTTMTFSVVDVTCNATAINPYLQVGSGVWQNTNNVTIISGETVKFGPQPSDAGSWSWLGAATGTTREISITPTSSCVVTATYTNACGKTSQKIHNITVNFKTGTNTLEDNPDLTLFPSPCRDHLNVQIAQSQIFDDCEIEIHTIQGALILNQIAKSNNISLDVSHLNPELYFLTCVLNGRKTTKSFVKVD